MANQELTGHHPICILLLIINRLKVPLRNYCKPCREKREKPDMVSSFFRTSFATVTACENLRNSPEKARFGFGIKPTSPGSCPPIRSSLSASPSYPFLQKSVVPVAASLAIILWSSPANAGFLSGFSGLESVPGPELPKIDFLNRFNEENQKKYSEFDARFKDSPLLKQLLEKSKLNKEKNKQEIQNKYCLRGAEWGVGDCSAEGMSPEDREKFIATLKEKVGVE